MFTNLDEKYMKRALELAGMAAGRTSPNPLVGAVIVKDGNIVGEGYHQKAGTPHAEIHALITAQGRAIGATMYVTLEPCSHFGSTPPCAQAIVESGIQEVVVATLDPNPKVAGRGIEILQNAGIRTRIGLMEKEACTQNEIFLKYITTGLPFVCMKYAMTLDGKIATYTGDSKWISNAESREYVHQLRNVYDAILVGIGTVLADNPNLNTRLNIPQPKDPIRVVIDGDLDIPLNSDIVKSSRQQKTILFTSIKSSNEKAALLSKNDIEIIRVSGEPTQIDLKEVINKLGSKGITSLLVEGGAQINASFLDNKLADKLLCFIAPKIVGGVAPSPVAGQGVAFMKNAYQFDEVNVKTIGNDTLIEAYTRW